MSRDRMVLTFPPEPGLARLVRLATLHFLRQQGIGPGAARTGARSVESRTRLVLDRARKAAARLKAKTAPPTPLSLTFVSTARACEVLLRPPNGAAARVLLLPRPAESR